MNQEQMDALRRRVQQALESDGFEEVELPPAEDDMGNVVSANLDGDMILLTIELA